MGVGHIDETNGFIIESPEARSASMKVLIDGNGGWKDHVMRVIELEEGGFSPKHTHDWPHINYMIEGKGILHIDGRDYPVTAGSYAFVPGGKLHQFRNNGSAPFKFICIVPTEGHVV